MFDAAPAPFGRGGRADAFGSGVDARDHRGRTPLHVLMGHRRAALRGTTLAVLLAAGADVRARDYRGRTPFAKADPAVARRARAIAARLRRAAASP